MEKYNLFLVFFAYIHRLQAYNICLNNLNCELSQCLILDNTGFQVKHLSLMSSLTTVRPQANRLPFFTLVIYLIK